MSVWIGKWGESLTFWSVLQVSSVLLWGRMLDRTGSQVTAVDWIVPVMICIVLISWVFCCFKLALQAVFYVGG